MFFSVLLQLKRSDLPISVVIHAGTDLPVSGDLVAIDACAMLAL